MAEQYGIIPEEVHNALTGTENSYDVVMENLTDKLKSLFIEKLEQTWFGDDAIKFGAALKSAVDSAGTSMEGIFSSINSTLNEAAQKEVEGKGTYDSVAHSPKVVNTNVENIIQKRGDGFMGITSSSEFDGCKSGFTAVKDAIVEACNSAKTSLASSGFYGDSEQDALNNSIDTIKKNIEALMGTLEEDSAEALKATLEREKEESAARARAFGAQQ